MAKKIKNKNQIVVYQSKNGAIEVKKDINLNTIWATQMDISKLFGKDQSVISRHINGIFKDKEIDQKSNMQKMHIPNSDKPVIFYSLDIILAVGYRANSKRAIEFRQWATKILKAHITKGYTINSKVIKNNYAEFQKAIENIKQLLPASSMVDRESVLELITAFASTWLSLDAYDKDTLVSKGARKKAITLSAQQLTEALAEFKNELLKNGTATKIFALERQNDSVGGIIGNVMQSFGGKQFYPTVEEKASHLLYFMVKNHPFTDGNKRCGAFAFAWFLKKAGLLEICKITPSALTALTIFVAESDPKHKEKIIRLILQLLKK